MRLVVAAMMCVLPLLFACSLPGENPKTHYATVAEARHDDAIGEHAAIPELLLPENATDITLQYDIDTNERWLTYTFIGPQAVRMSGCTRVATLNIDVISAPSWWSRAAAAIANDAEKYRCIDRGELAGYWLSYECVLVQSSTKGAWSCDSGRQVPK